MNIQYDQWILYPEYLYTVSEAAAINVDIRKKVNKVVDGVKSFSNNIFRLEKYLHDSVVKSVAYDYFNLTTEDILLDYRPLGKLPFCNSDALNYFHRTNSFISSYEELIGLIENRYESKEIVFRVKKGSTEFQRGDELKEKTMAAVLHVMNKNMNPKPFTMLFNNLHKIGKIIF